MAIGMQMIIANALDDASAHVRRAGAEREPAALVGLGVDAVELDLREYFGQEQRLRRDLAWVSLAWLRGGNVFMLRYALRRGGVSRLSGGIGRAANRPNARTMLHVAALRSGRLCACFGRVVSRNR